MIAEAELTHETTSLQTTKLAPFAEFAAVIKKETPEWAKVIKDADIKLGN